MVLHPVGSSIILYIALKMQLCWNGWSYHCPCHTGRAEVLHLSFLISALGVDEWSTWCPR